ncbi:MAG: hypothetical protein ACOYO1_08005 [Bacteroidales bacterium]
MLTDAEYSKLWKGYFKISKITMPDYDDYVIRENMLQDYLDIFRGKNTKFNKEIGIEVPKIKYILIAEAPPPKNKNGIVYIYNTNIENGGPYIDAPLKAFCEDETEYRRIKNSGTLGKLIFLAKKGVLILDLFPFAFKYTSEFRKRMNNIGITASFFDDPLNTFSIRNRIDSLINEGLFTNEIKPNACFIAPPIISHHLAQYVNHRLCPFLNFRLGFSELLNPNPLLPIPTLPFISITHFPNDILGIYHNYALIGITKIPTYNCSGYAGAGLPHHLFIKNSFGL